MLLWKECKRVLCSLTFVLYVVVVVFMYVTQFGEELDAPVKAPVVGEESYGVTLREDPEILMPAAVDQLLGDYLSGRYIAYPIGFYKEVRLTEEKRLKMRELLEELTGLSGEELDRSEDYREESYTYDDVDENGNPILHYQESVLPEYHLPESLTYERFCELMDQADTLLGGGSDFSEVYRLSHFGKVPMTYEEAVTEYEELIQPEQLGNAYLRLQCDYLGIDLAVMPVFVAVSLWQMDKKARIQSLIYTRKSSAIRIVGTRYLALVSCMAVPVLLTILNTIIYVNRLYPGTEIVWSSAFGAALLWLLPSILAVTAVGALLTEVTSPLLAIFLQSVWWFVALSKTQLTGDIQPLGLIVRHNCLGKTMIWQNQWDNFVCNRLLLTLLAVLCLMMTVWLYERKRRGSFTWMENLRCDKRNASMASCLHDR